MYIHVHCILYDISYKRDVRLSFFRHNQRKRTADRISIHQMDIKIENVNVTPLRDINLTTPKVDLNNVNRI